MFVLCILLIVRSYCCCLLVTYVSLLRFCEWFAVLDGLITLCCLGVLWLIITLVGYGMIWLVTCNLVSNLLFVLLAAWCVCFLIYCFCWVVCCFDDF